MPSPRRFALDLVAMAAIAATACASKPPSARPEPLPTQSVQTERARLDTTVAGGEVAIGTVRARNSAAISSTVVGTVRVLNVTLGRRVRAGDVLVRISADEIGAKLDQTQAL